MTAGDRRKYLPLEGYRFLALALLRDRGETGVSKGELAWETRSNHYMATRLLRALVADGSIRVDGGPEDGFVIRITPEGAAFLDANTGYGVQVFGAALRAHFRFGRVPAWAQPLVR